MRTNGPVFRKMLHKGAVNSIKVVEEQSLLLSCSASGSISVISVPHFEEVLTINANDMVFCLEEVFGTILASTAKGNVLGYDLQTGKALYGYGVMKKGGCRQLGVNEDKTRLVCAGEDESATLLFYK
jgi:WD40 repeat protein